MRRVNRRKSGWALPKSVRTPLGLVKTHVVNGLHDDEGAALGGQANFATLRLNIHPEVREEWAPRAQCRLYYHEWTHFALEAAGLGAGALFNKEQVEAICDAISTARMVEEMGP